MSSRERSRKLLNAYAEDVLTVVCYLCGKENELQLDELFIYSRGALRQGYNGALTPPIQKQSGSSWLSHYRVSHSGPYARCALARRPIDKVISPVTQERNTTRDFVITDTNVPCAVSRIGNKQSKSLHEIALANQLRLVPVLLSLKAHSCNKEPSIAA
jgi:hypothetical protein